MKLVFKNKMLMGIEAMLAEGSKKGGIPKHILIDTQEAIDLLQEVKYLKIGADYDKPGPHHLTKFSFKTPLNDLTDNEHPAFLLGLFRDDNVTTLLPQSLNLLIEFWQKGELEVYVKHNVVNLIPILLPTSATKSDVNEWVE